ncbi:hypothetical protein AAFC00_001423 [Neodothiora populina]|uniref:Uncharacterized protein n=1 Tax=Neodothiora populina TaxID=2781224 RepID=A0ABR3PPX1_9PEZI
MASPIVKATIQAASLSAVSNILAQLISCYQTGKSFSIDPVPLGQFVTFSLMSCPPNYLWQSWLEATFPGYTAASEHGTMDSIAQNAGVKQITDKTGPALQALNEKTAPALQSISDTTGPALQALNEKTAPAFQTISDQTSAAASATQDSEIVHQVRRRATEGVETVKAKAKEYEARAGLNSAFTKASDLITPQTFSTPDGKIIEKAADGAVQPDTRSSTKKKLNVKNTAIKFSLDQTFGAIVNTVFFIAGIGALRGESLAYIASNVKNDSIPLLLAGQKLWPAVSLISFTLIPVEQRTVFGGVVGVGWGIFLSLLAGGKK